MGYILPTSFLPSRVDRENSAWHAFLSTQYEGLAGLIRAAIQLEGQICSRHGIIIKPDLQVSLSLALLCWGIFNFFFKKLYHQILGRLMP